MRRYLVVTDDVARHPFRASLPPHVLRGLAEIRMPRSQRSLIESLRDFLLAYCACFVAVSTFIL